MRAGAVGEGITGAHAQQLLASSPAEGVFRAM